MAALMIMALLIISSVVGSPGNKDILVAVEEMERANYFTFVMLINMIPPNLFQGNVTFLMPSDRSLSRTTVIPAQNSVVDLLLRHSIPSPLLFDHLLHLPTNSMLPTSNPDLMLKVSNSGRRSFFLGNVKIVSPNICTNGYSVRCHGIDGVISIDKPQLASPITCPRVASAAAPLLAPPSPSPSPSPAPASDPPHGAAYETSVGGRPGMDLALTTCVAFVWLLYTKVKPCV